MQTGPDHMGAPASFANRRPNASHLPNFELPPPPLANMHQKFQSYPTINSNQPSSTSAALTSVGHLLTPPTNSSADGMSPTSGINGSSIPNQGAVQPYTPSSGGGMWPPPSNSSSVYGFQSSAPQFSNQGRGLFSPSLNSIVRSNSSPTANEGLPPPPYELPQYSPSSMSMSAPSLPAAQHQQHQHQQHQHQQQQHQQQQQQHQPQQLYANTMVGGQNSSSATVTHPSPVSAQEAFARPPPTPTYYSGSQPSSTPQQASFPYSTGPSPILQSPVSAGGPLSRVSPVNGHSHGHGSVPSLHTQHSQHSQPPQYPQRPYSYPGLAGPVLSNINNPNGQMALVGGVPHGGMPMHYNSGHAAMYHLQGHHPSQPNPQNDRPFRCDQCPQSFNRNHDLKRHKRIHLAVKPFPCGHCDKSFSRKDALKRHVLVKGCGKAHASAEIKELDGSISPEAKSEPGTSPIR